MHSKVFVELKFIRFKMDRPRHYIKFNSTERTNFEFGRYSNAEMNKMKKKPHSHTQQKRLENPESGVP